MDKSMDESQVKQSKADFPQELIIKSYQSQKKKLDFSSPQKTQVFNMKDKPNPGGRVMPSIKIKASKNTTRKIFSYQNKDDNEDSEKGDIEFFEQTSERYFDDY